MTYKVEAVVTEIQYFIRHDADGILSFHVALKPITIEYHKYIEWIYFLDGCLTIVTVSHATTLGVSVSLNWM